MKKYLVPWFASCTSQLLKLSWKRSLAWIHTCFGITAVASLLGQCWLHTVPSGDSSGEVRFIHISRKNRGTSSPEHSGTRAGNERCKGNVRASCFCQNNHGALICRMHWSTFHNSLGFDEGPMRGEDRSSPQYPGGWDSVNRCGEGTCSALFLPQLCCWGPGFIQWKEQGPWSRRLPWAASREGRGKRWNLKLWSHDLLWSPAEPGRSFTFVQVRHWYPYATSHGWVLLAPAQLLVLAWEEVMKSPKPTETDALRPVFVRQGTQKMRVNQQLEGIPCLSARG